LSVERFVEEAFDFGPEIILRPAALKAFVKTFEALVIEPQGLQSDVGVLVWQKVWGKGVLVWRVRAGGVSRSASLRRR
jgi:hypothetical protein